MRRYLALNDPQWLGHFFMMSALLTILPVRAAEGPAPCRVLIAVVLMLLGGLTKQNLVGWPIALTAWLGWHHRSSGIWWVVGSLICVAVASIACEFVFGVDFFWDVFYSDRITSIGRMIYGTRAAILIMLAFLLWWSWPILRHKPEDDRLDLVRFAVAVTVPLGIIERSGAGVDINAHFESVIALSISSSLALQCRLSKRVDRILGGVALGVLFTVGFAREVKETRPLSMRYAAWQAMERKITTMPGEVACETQALCFWAGKSFVIDFFHYSQYARRVHATRELDRALADGRITAVQIDADPAVEDPDRRTDPTLLRLYSTLRPVYGDTAGRNLLTRK